jgi:dihydrofolate reductase
MATIVANLVMSLDGFIAQPDDDPGPLFDFYESGPVELELADGWPTFHMHEPSATLFRSAVASVGCHLVGRRLYDLTGGWGGHPGNEAPMVVLTHEAPDSHPDGVPYHFVPDVRRAVELASSIAGSRTVAVAGAATARAVLDAGLLDVIDVALAPVVLGAGIPWFAGASGPVRLSDPEIIPAPGVTHLRYRVLPPTAG